MIFFCLLASAFYFAGYFLIYDDELTEPADIAFIMMGGRGERAEKAFKLYQAGLVKKIVFAKDKDLDYFGKTSGECSSTYLTKQYLKTLGVKSDDILILEDDVASTLDEISVLNNYLLEQKKISSIVFVSSQYHTKRVRWVVDKYLDKSALKDVYIKAAPFGTVGYNQWWRNEDTFLFVINEYLKWIYYLMRYWLN